MPVTASSVPMKPIPVISKAFTRVLSSWCASRLEGRPKGQDTRDSWEFPARDAPATPSLRSPLPRRVIDSDGFSAENPSAAMTRRGW